MHSYLKKLKCCCHTKTGIGRQSPTNMSWWHQHDRIHLLVCRGKDHSWNQKDEPCMIYYDTVLILEQWSLAGNCHPPLTCTVLLQAFNWITPRMDIDLQSTTFWNLPYRICRTHFRLSRGENHLSKIWADNLCIPEYMSRYQVWVSSKDYACYWNNTKSE